MGNTSAKCPLGLPKFTNVYHGIFSLFFSIQNRGNKPSESNDAFLKGHVGTKEGER